MAVADSFDPRYSTETNDYDMGVITLAAPGLTLAPGSAINSIAPVDPADTNQASPTPARR